MIKAGSAVLHGEQVKRSFVKHVMVGCCIVPSCDLAGFALLHMFGSVAVKSNHCGCTDSKELLVE